MRCFHLLGPKLDIGVIDSWKLKAWRVLMSGPINILELEFQGVLGAPHSSFRGYIQMLDTPKCERDLSIRDI